MQVKLLIMGSKAALVRQRRLDNAEYLKVFTINDTFQSRLKAYIKDNNLTVDDQTKQMFPFLK